MSIGFEGTQAGVTELVKLVPFLHPHTHTHMCAHTLKVYSCEYVIECFMVFDGIFHVVGFLWLVIEL